MNETSFSGRKITFPIVLDDRWNREALDRYMKSIRNEAVYLPSNIEYLARNNGLTNGAEALDLLVRSDWVHCSHFHLLKTRTDVLDSLCSESDSISHVHSLSRCVLSAYSSVY